MRNQLRLLGLSVFASGAVALAAGCGDSDGAGAAGAAGTGAAGAGSTASFIPSNGLIMTPLSAYETSEAIANADPPAGDHYIIVEVTLENKTGESLPLIPASFAIQTPGGVAYQGSPLSEALENGCVSAASLADEGQTTCALAFTVPAGTTAELLIYTAQDDTYEAALDTTACTACGDGSCSQTCCELLNTPQPVECFDKCKVIHDCAGLTCDGVVLCPSIANQTFEDYIDAGCEQGCGSSGLSFVDPSDCRATLAPIVTCP